MIVVHETGLAALSMDGTQRWKLTRDVVEAVHLRGDRLEISFMDEAPVSVAIDSGHELQVQLAPIWESQQYQQYSLAHAEQPFATLAATGGRRSARRPVPQRRISKFPIQQPGGRKRRCCASAEGVTRHPRMGAV